VREPSDRDWYIGESNFDPSTAGALESVACLLLHYDLVRSVRTLVYLSFTMLWPWSRNLTFAVMVLNPNIPGSPPSRIAGTLLRFGMKHDMRNKRMAPVTRVMALSDAIMVQCATLCALASVGKVMLICTFTVPPQRGSAYLSIGNA
jgi:hypothetical protein